MVTLQDSIGESIENYYANTQTAVDLLRDWGKDGHEDVIELKMSIAIDQVSERYQVVTDETEEGPVIEDRELVHPADVIELVAVYRSKMDELDDRVEEFDEAFEQAEEDYLNAVEMRREIRDWLARTGVQPEHFDALTEAMVQAMRETR